MSAFTIVEPASKAFSRLSVGTYALAAHPSPLLDIARIFTGSVDFREPEGGRSFRSRNNYLTGARPVSTPSALSKAISENVTPDVIEKFIQRARYKNIGFFKGLRDEVAQAIYYQNCGGSADSFVHTYRAIEFIAEACGLLYVTYQDDFTKSMQFFKAIYSDESMGPIGLLSATLEKIAQSESLDAVTFDFTPGAISSGYVPRIGSQLRKIGVPELQGVTFSWDEVNGYLISVPFPHLARFISTVRNRTYHNQRSGANIDLMPIGGLGPITSMLVPPTLSWIATLYFTLLRALLNREADSFEAS